MKVHEALAAALRETGVDVVFGLVGDANLYLMQRFQALGGRFVPVANEASAPLAAAGYASVTGRVGVSTVTDGPGLTNTVTALVEGVKHRSATVLIAGDTAAGDEENFQDIDQHALVAATGAGLVQVGSPESAVRDLRAALRQAASERRPVVLNVPIDFQWAEVEAEVEPGAGIGAAADAVPAPDPEQVENAVAVIAAARRPVVLAGRGAIAARDDLLALARRIGAPVATTAQARQLFRDDPLDLGIFGGLAEEAGLAELLQADCVIAFGASLNRYTTAEGSLLAGRRLVQVDVEEAALGRRHEPDAVVLGDSGAAARAMLALVAEAELEPSGFGSPALTERVAVGRTAAAEARAAHRSRELVREAAGERPGGSIDLDLALWTVETAFPAERNLVIDAGRWCMVGLGVLSVTEARRYVHTINLGAIGLGLPYAIGAAVAAPDRPTLMACGDGGFMLGGLVELATAVHEDLDLVVVVFDDAAYGAEHIQLVRKGLDPAISALALPDLAAAATALGGTGFTARSIPELDAALAEVSARAEAGRIGVVLIDIRMDADELSAAGVGTR